MADLFGDSQTVLSGLIARLNQLFADKIKVASDSAAAAKTSELNAAQSASDAASSANNPDATTTVKGKVRLAGDLGGTANAPTVPGLAGKANASRAHAVADVSGLQSALDGKANTTTVNSRPALFSGAGVPPAAIEGAVVGDWWLDTDTMELSKITGV